MSTLLAEQAATRLLLRQRLHNLRFDITGLDFEYDILFDTFQHYCANTSSAMSHIADGAGRDGLTVRVKRGGKPIHIVLYNEHSRAPRRRFTLAHEIGHIYLDHLADDDREEREADAFAAQLLMPRILVRQLARLWKSALDEAFLCEVFGVSRGAARIRLRDVSCGHPYDRNDDLLLKRFAPLLPLPGEPFITVS